MKHSKKYRIVFAGLLSEKNLGDVIIADCTKWLFTQILKSSEEDKVIFDEIGFRELEEVRRSSFYRKKCYEVRRRLLPLVGMNWSKKNIQEHAKYFEPCFVDADLVVIVGGGVVKYKYQLFWVYLSGIIKAAQVNNIPIILNAVGIEGYDADNEKCQILKEALNAPNVKAITTRDDISVLDKYYINASSGIYTQKVADSAVWVSDAYGIHKEEHADVVGIGLVRSEIFKDNGIALSSEELVQIYVNILQELDRKGHKWKLFTNGLPADEELIPAILDQLGRNRSMVDILLPSSGEELVKGLAHFKGVIAARLHANIVAYSLEVPSVGLVWNKKLLLFGESIGYKERFIVKDNFSAAYIVNHLETAISEGYDKKKMSPFKHSVRKSITDILTQNGFL